MTEIVSSFFPVRIADFDYLFLLTNDRYCATQIQESLYKYTELFGEDISLKAKIVKAYQHQSIEAYNQICNKPWQKEIGERIAKERDPFILIIRTDFASFDPNQDEWRILFWSDFEADPDSIARVFAQLAKLVREESDVFKWLDALQQQSLGESVTSLPKLEVARGEGAKQAHKRRPKGKPGVKRIYDRDMIFEKVDALYDSESQPTSYGDCAQKIIEWAEENKKVVPDLDYLEKMIGEYIRKYNKKIS